VESLYKSIANSNTLGQFALLRRYTIEWDFSIPVNDNSFFFIGVSGKDPVESID
jgi:hypothetical protein